MTARMNAADTQGRFKKKAQRQVTRSEKALPIGPPIIRPAAHSALILAMRLGALQDDSSLVSGAKSER